MPIFLAGKYKARMAETEADITACQQLRRITVDIARHLVDIERGREIAAILARGVLRQPGDRKSLENGVGATGGMPW